eukprot:Rmarinus@m.29668
MGGTCSTKRKKAVAAIGPSGEQPRDHEIHFHNGGRPTGFDRWLPAGSDVPTLQELCIHSIITYIYSTPSVLSHLQHLPPAITQKIHDILVKHVPLRDNAFQSFAGCGLRTLRLTGSQVEDAWLSKASSWRSLPSTLTTLDLTACTKLTPTALSSVSQFSSLRELKVDGCVDLADGSFSGLSRLTDLRSFSASGCFGLTGEFLTHLPTSITQLHLPRCRGLQRAGLWHLTRFRGLEVLDVGWCLGLDNYALFPIKELVQIKHLKLTSTKITDDFLLEIGRALLHLETLSVGHCDVSDDGLVAMQAGHPKMKSLNLESCLITDNSLSVLLSLPDLVELNVMGTYVTDIGMNRLFSAEQPPMLMVLNLDTCAISDNGLRNISNVRNTLTALDLTDTAVTDNTMSQLVQLTTLTSLDLSGTAIGDECVPSLGALPQSLRFLSLDTKSIGDSSMKSVSRLKNLVYLDLFGAKISDSGLLHLAMLPNLRKLEVCGGLLTDVGMRTLGRMTTLTFLNITQNFRVTDLGVKYLARLKGLETLIVGHTRVSGAGLRFLVHHLPSLRWLGVSGCRISKSSMEKLQACRGQVMISGQDSAS